MQMQLLHKQQLLSCSVGHGQVFHVSGQMNQQYYIRNT